MTLTEQQAGDLDGAISHLQEALQIALRVRYQQGIATFTSNLAALAGKQKNWLELERMAREALPLAEAMGWQELIAANCYNLANALCRMGRFSEAHPLAVRSQAIYEKLAAPEAIEAQALAATCAPKPV